ncbi:PilZ domain-containing protein [Klenkia brasiliensis]|uniref:PilZ domain-containing protein n=1 Tax=Klenkia brasiliensis TaxID=333142 RepID=A0A1G7ME54_9ACTN|nr:PilZ domain-containing protein [Klenkia brasiliensis]SDF59961.1 PilZ domain-containing protein [Klenkia brasiliensis]
MVVELPVPGALVDVVAGAEVVTGRVAQRHADGVVVELPVAPAATEPLRLYWTAPEGVHTVLARVAMRWPVRTGVRWQLLPVGAAERGNRRDAVRAPLRLKVQLTERDSRLVLRGRTTDLSEAGLRGRLELGAGAPVEGAAVDIGLLLRGAVFPLPGQLQTVIGDETGWDVTVAFVDLAESLQDLIRAQVFAALREQRRLSLL